ncbi:glutathione-regulated potassium-efflux system ancillary protein KefG [Paenibacillus rhizosphaerae]|uniref:Glutathione-regulated potassium-efflux system ancillary protein KefG n=1 Tax=Paenibacillus rhizosphaerae TaxID=297318 RepID=A0A839TZ21_9BACL|nr:NAD(P)H-dependent oxidoreductase [Paenibacillus rhizosphaerae]MBB3130648.1 glutathione-regulated potassium-efflux system ancillary protein KefG [Paenibacillus rhizosphaerae]
MKTMVIVSHPDLSRSKANRALLEALPKHTDIHVRDLYQEYPDWQIDADREKQLLLAYDRIVLQFPFYWYSSPPLLKKWFDDVLTPGWAYGPGGEHLKGKEFIVVTTAGGTDKSFQAGGENWFTISELLKPIHLTIAHCHGTFLPPFVVYDANRASQEQLKTEGIRYAEYIQTPSPVLIH